MFMLTRLSKIKIEKINLQSKFVYMENCDLGKILATELLLSGFKSLGLGTVPYPKYQEHGYKNT